MKNQRGITLIALIITIIVLLILAVVTIAGIRGDAIINHAENARNEWQVATVTENTQLTNYINLIDKYASEDSGEEMIPLENAQITYSCERVNEDEVVFYKVPIAGRSALKQEGNQYTMKFYFTLDSYTTLNNVSGLRAGYASDYDSGNYGITSSLATFEPEGDYYVITIHAPSITYSEVIGWGGEHDDEPIETIHHQVIFVLGYDDEQRQYASCDTPFGVYGIYGPEFYGPYTFPVDLD